jgi:hypothetical protein
MGRGNPDGNVEAGLGEMGELVDVGGGAMDGEAGAQPATRAATTAMRVPTKPLLLMRSMP